MPFPYSARALDGYTSSTWNLLYNSWNYKEWYKEHLDNSIYRPLIAQIVENLESSKEVGKG